MCIRGRRSWVSTVMVWAVLIGITPVINGQLPGRKVVPPQPKVPVAPKGPMGPKAPTPSPGKAKGPKLPEPEDVSLETKDGVTLKATYYGGTAKKESVPIIMIHGFEGQRGDFHGMALTLQAMGHAVIVPDLRGHGQSKLGKAADGSPVNLTADKLKRDDLEAMVLDVEACKKYLLEKNNTGELNIEMLTVIGAEFGTIVAVRWAAADWAARDLPAYKQGRDVKALVLLSPMASFKAVTMRDALKFAPVQSQLSMMLIAGTKDTKSTTEAKKIYDALQNFHPKASDDPEERRKTQELYLVQPEVSLSGTKLLGNAVAVRDLTVREMIGIFIDRRLVDRKADFSWQDRKSPF